MPKIDMAIMEVELPDATAAKNVDVQLLKVEFLDDVYKVFNQEIVLPRAAVKSTFIVPEGSVYTLTLGYADIQNDGTKQVSWGQSVQLTHTDELMPDAPGPFGAIRMIDEVEGELEEPGVPDEPVADEPVDDPADDTTDGPSDDPVDDPAGDGDLDDPNGSGSGGPIENLPQDETDPPPSGFGSL
jgi:hypothetical protein